MDWIREDSRPFIVRRFFWEVEGPEDFRPDFRGEGSLGGVGWKERGVVGD